MRIKIKIKQLVANDYYTDISEWICKQIWYVRDTYSINWIMFSTYDMARTWEVLCRRHGLNPTYDCHTGICLLYGFIYKTI